MVDSGKTLDLGVLRRPVLDKHSSGGVGDKVTLVLAPLVAACGAIFGKMSGRGLGHTGGTLDKLESIPGFRVQLPQGDFLRQLERIGVAVVSQSERIVPADRLLYALRDVTGTVECDGLIAASIMAKKVASGTSALVLDLKVGTRRLRGRPGPRQGDRPPLPPDRGRLRAPDRPVCTPPWTRRSGARSATGSRSRRRGRCSSGEGPRDVREVTLELAAELLPLSDLGVDAAEARARAEAALRRRARRRALRALVLRAGRPLAAGRVPPAGRARGQGAAGRVRDRRRRARRRARGAARREPAAARWTTPSTRRPASCSSTAVGDAVEAGEPLAAVFSRDPARRREASRVLETAFTVARRRRRAARPRRECVLGREDAAAGEA